MTTIAYCRGILAADTLVSNNGARWAWTSKIAKRGKLLAGACGSGQLCRRFMDWFAKGAEGAPPPMAFSEDCSASGVIFLDDFRFATFDEVGVNELSAPYFALGSGARYAIGVLATGASPKRAIEVAAEHDIYTGGDIHTLNRYFDDERVRVHRLVPGHYADGAPLDASRGNVVPLRAA